MRVGLDAALGLVPCVGDLAGAAVSAYVLLVAARLGASPAVLGRMLVNTGIDALVGAVPLLGDLFDIGWRANSRNVALLERHLADPAGTRRASRGVVGLVLAGLVVLAALGIALSVLLVRALVGLVR
jgi:small-conductance mechanosensitive channel